MPDLPLLIDFEHFFADKQYRCLKEEQFQSTEDVETLCLEKDFWPHRQRKSCLIYSFTGRRNFAFENSLGSQLGCSVHVFKPGRLQ